MACRTSWFAVSESVTSRVSSGSLNTVQNVATGSPAPNAVAEAAACAALALALANAGSTFDSGFVYLGPTMQPAVVMATTPAMRSLLNMRASFRSRDAWIDGVMVRLLIQPLRRGGGRRG